MSHPIGQYYGTSKRLQPPPGYSAKGFRNGVRRGELPGHKLPGKAGVVVSVAEWDEWLRARAGSHAVTIDPIEADIRARFRCAS